MPHAYRSLPPTLHDTADAAIEWFAKRWGISKNQIGIEVAFDPDINFRPTFTALTKDHHILCVEVSENIYNNTLDSVVIHCRDKGLPVKMFVAVPKDLSDAAYSTKLKAAKRAGVGILEVDHASGTIIQQPLSLSLVGVRSIDLASFPNKYKQSLQHAHQTFLDGEPAKASALVYDELENACKKFAEKSESKGLWVNNLNNTIAKAGWAPLMTSLDRTLNRGTPQTKPITPALCARIIGVTTHRNDAGHLPKSAKQLKQRDQTLRTRFETAVDLFEEFLDAAKAMRI